MHRPDVDEVVNYLSTKFNKIFCDREFVHLVIQDFQGISNNKNKCCVLLFPALEPIYQKAIRYQAEIFDLAVFPVATGSFKSIAVCHKDYIIKQQTEFKEVKQKPKQESIMSEITSKCSSSSIPSRHKRPERMLYVPPAQRVSRLNKPQSQDNSQKECKPKIRNRCNDVTSTIITHKKDLNKQIASLEKFEIGESSQDIINKSVCDNELEIEQNGSCSNLGRLVNNDSTCRENNRYIFDINESYTIINNNTVHSLCINYKISKSELSEFNVLKESVLNNEVSYIQDKFKTFSKYNSDSEIIHRCIPFYNCLKYPSVLYVLTSNFVSWLPVQPVFCANQNCASDSNTRTFPLFDFSSYDTQIKYNFKPVSVLCTNSIDPIDYENNVVISDTFNTERFPFKIMCDSDCTKFDFFLSENCETIPEVREIKPDINVETEGKVNKYIGKHDLPVSDNIKLHENTPQNENSTKSETITSDNLNVHNHSIRTEDHKINSVPEATTFEPIKSCNTVLIISDDKQENKTRNKMSNEIEKNSNKDTVRNKLNKSGEKPSKLPTKKNDHEEEKEIMRKAKENINRKTRPIMKYMDDSNDLLPIDKDDENINNWEDLFDDNGQLQGDLLTGIVQKVGDDFTIVKAVEDYSEYATKAMENLEHIVELYDFPSTFGTPDIMQAFSFIRSDAIYIKWVDDTHALLVLGSLLQAQRALKQENPLIKVRPMTAASSVSLEVANKSDLKPAMKRPQTNLQTARRLITTHLGAKSRISKEQSAKERNDLKNAREMKKLTRQNEKDAWEGNLRSTVK